MMGRTRWSAVAWISSSLKSCRKSGRWYGYFTLAPRLADAEDDDEEVPLTWLALEGALPEPAKPLVSAAVAWPFSAPSSWPMALYSALRKRPIIAKSLSNVRSQSPFLAHSGPFYGNVVLLQREQRPTSHFTFLTLALGSGSGWQLLGKQGLFALFSKGLQRRKGFFRTLLGQLGRLHVVECMSKRTASPQVKLE